jgi:ESF2/ABP1 family protein
MVFKFLLLEMMRLEKNLEDIRGMKTLEIDEEFMKNKEQRIEEAKEFREKQRRKGIIYLPSVPPYMNPNTIKKLLGKFDIERVYFRPEPDHKRKIRKKNGGNSKQKFVEGWVEFSDKKEARRVAQALNGQLIGGKKRHNIYRDDTWLMRYLPKFKWEDLKERFTYDRKAREERLKMNLSQAKREQTFFVKSAEVLLLYIFLGIQKGQIR